jgi:hypothetical protein
MSDRFLFIYSSPQGESRLRIDKEHRLLDDLLSRNCVPLDSVVRLQAATMYSIAAELARKHFTVIHFSGHGDRSGIFLESSSSTEGERIEAHHFVALLKSAGIEPRLLVCLSCWSADVVPILLQAAPYVISVTGKISDEAALTFVEYFYCRIFVGNSIRASFGIAQLMMEVFGIEGKALLSHRSLCSDNETPLFEVFPRGDGPYTMIDSFCVDIGDVKQSLSGFGIALDDFLDSLTRKLRIHHWIFSHPRERALLQIGSFFGLFSWGEQAPVIRCHELIVIDPTTDETLLEAWGGLLVSHNQHYVEKYRLVNNPSSPEMARHHADAIKAYEGTFDTYIASEKKGNALRKAVPAVFVSCKATIPAHIRMARDQLAQGDLTSTVLYLEIILSAFHDLINAVTSAVRQQPEE